MLLKSFQNPSNIGSFLSSLSKKPEIWRLVVSNGQNAQEEASK